MSGENMDSTIVLDSSQDVSNVEGDESTVFKPVKPGGKKLDDTIDLSDSDDNEEKFKEDTEESHYLTSVQSPTQMSFQTPVQRSNELPVAASTPMAPHANGHSQQHSMKVIQDVLTPQMNSNAYEIEDEFCQSMEEAPPTPKRSNGLKQNETVGRNSEKIDDGEGDISSESEVTVHEDDESEVTQNILEVSNSKKRMQSESRDGDSETEDKIPDMAAPLPKKPKSFSEEDLPKTCSVLRTSSGNGILYLIGTAHFSKESCEDVATVIQTVQPDVVALELCPGRTEILRLDEATLRAEAENLSFNKIISIIKRFGKVHGLMYTLMLSMSVTLTKELGMAPGGEFRTAVKEASKVPGCMVTLGDRPIEITIRRALASLSIWQKIKIAFSIIFSKDKITKEEVEKCKDKDILESLMEEMAGEYGDLAKVFVNERDICLSYHLRNAAVPKIPLRVHGRPQTVVGVVGIGHVAGIKSNWEKVSSSDVRRVMVIPQKSPAEKVLGHAVKAGFYCLLLYGGYRFLRGPTSRLFNKITQNMKT